MINKVQWTDLRNEISDIVFMESRIRDEYGEDSYVYNYDYVASKILEKLVELGLIEVENK